VSEPTPRQVLYALVAGGFLVVVLVLTVGAAVVGVVPVWWTVTMAILCAMVAIWSSLNWKRTGPVLLLAIGVFLLWAMATLLVADL